ncbi:hypothetical protein NDU88_002359 [Pleurodeles waltl]|uniref:Uncharacterized protein n=1 Tax=Pleurodeles waltl TaxID=8319 RepID=A0AAV7KRX6_PLEWA|nr:hypothetical protein NDU88_002359 [Pleurodeles waltl]
MSTLPEDTEQSERGKIEAHSRPSSRGLGCGDSPTRPPLEPEGERLALRYYLHLGGGSTAVPGPTTGRGAAYPSLLPGQSAPERENGADRRCGPEQEEARHWWHTSQCLLNPAPSGATEHGEPPLGLPPPSDW